VALYPHTIDIVAVQWSLDEQLLTSAVDGEEVVDIDGTFDAWI